MRGSPIPAACAVAALVAFSLPARATTVLPLSMEDLVERSDVVARVRVGEVRVLPRGQVPYRVTQLIVEEGFQGARRGEILELWQRGDGLLFVVGDPILETGQQGLAFLRRVEGRIYLTALAQSFWWLEGQGEDLRARRDLSGLAILPVVGREAMPPNRSRWALLRRMVLETCMGVHR